MTCACRARAAQGEAASLYTYTHLHAKRPQLLPQGMRDALQRRLGGRIHSSEGGEAKTGHAADIDDFALPLSNHVLRNGLQYAMHA